MADRERRDRRGWYVVQVTPAGDKGARLRGAGAWRRGTSSEGVLEAVAEEPVAVAPVQ